MAGLLLSGPAGAGKSQEAARLVAEATTPTVLADFQAITVAVLGHVRRRDGSYPKRPSWSLPLIERIRRTVIDDATAREFDVIATNSDGDPERRAALLNRLGPGATERVIDPGREVVEARLTDAITGELDPECTAAIGRWYGRLR